ncbi:MAG TPA: ribbon-helix-helix protein, CopG family [Acidimicrobiales bacterium]|nr:ribbon-helix-helix protein, CopG family [Acidimicrobiales bacterium]
MSVRVPVEVRDRLKERAQQEDRTMAQALRRAVRAYVNSPPEPEPSL